MGLLCLGLLLSLDAGRSATHAQEAAAPSEDEIAAARARFAEGLALSDAGEWEAAAAVFHEVLAVVSSPPVLFNLAHALVELNQFDEADELIERLQADPAIDRDLTRRSRQLRSRMTLRGGQLTLDASALPEGSVVLLNGRPLPSERLGQPLRVSAGAHHVSVTDAPGGSEIATVDVSITRRGRETLALAPDAQLVAAAEARAVEAARLEAEAAAQAEADAEAERVRAEQAEMARLEAEYEASRSSGHLVDTESAFAVRQAQLAREREAEELRRATERANRHHEAVPLQRNWRFWTVVGVVAAAAVGVGVAVAVSNDEVPNRGALGNFSPGRVEF